MFTYFNIVRFFRADLLSADQLDKLINEHFLGKDRPLPIGQYSYGSATDVVYRYAEGKLFGNNNDISYEDVKQGAIGDCYYLASLAAVAQKTPNVIRDMFIDNGDGTYTVRFFNKGQADYVTVDRYLPTDKNDGSLPFAKLGGYWNTYQNSANELWVALAEKAYAQINEAGWIGQDNTNTYKGIEYGWPVDSTAQISGKNGTTYSTINSTSDNLISDFNSGKLVCLASKSSGVTSPVVTGHAYTLVGYDNYNKIFKIFNPWGIGNGQDGGYLNFTWSQVQANFGHWTVNG